MNSSFPYARGLVRLFAGSAMALALLGSHPTLANFQPHPSAERSHPNRGHHRPYEREVSDQEHARQQRASGQNRSFEELFQRASAIGRGEYLGVEPDISRNIYRFKFMRPSGNIVWVDMDGRSGRVVAERQ